MFGRSFLLLSLVLAIGCGGPTSTRRTVQGSVTLKGQPLDQGTITFFPASGGGSVGGALITNGKYLLPAEQGLEPGSYRIAISSPEPSTTTPEEYAAGKMPLSAPDRIPNDFNAASKHTIEVTASGANTFDFAVP
jgi:hypothetical protein